MKKLRGYKKKINSRERFVSSWKLGKIFRGGVDCDVHKSQITGPQFKSICCFPRSCCIQSIKNWVPQRIDPRQRWKRNQLILTFWLWGCYTKYHQKHYCCAGWSEDPRADTEADNSSTRWFIDLWYSLSWAFQTESPSGNVEVVDEGAVAHSDAGSAGYTGQHRGRQSLKRWGGLDGWMAGWLEQVAQEAGGSMITGGRARK